MVNFAPGAKDGVRRRRSRITQRKKKIHKKILVTGCCRSGTTTMTKFLQECGFDVQHEMMGEDGTVSGYFFKDWMWYPMGKHADSHIDEQFSWYSFATIIQLVRHPLKVIRSQATLYVKNHKIWLDENDLVSLDVKPNILHAANLWLVQNEIIETFSDMLINIEDLYDDSTWEDLNFMLDLEGKEKPEFKQLNKATGYHVREPLTWKDLEELDPKLTLKIRHKAEEYGYETS